MQRWIRENFSLMAAPRTGSNPAQIQRWQNGSPRARRDFRPTQSPSRHRLKDKTLQIFGLRQMRQNRMIERLRQRFEPAQMSFGIDAGINDDLQ
jgi:hypothetical protein